MNKNINMSNQICPEGYICTDTICAPACGTNAIMNYTITCTDCDCYEPTSVYFKPITKELINFKNNKDD